MSVVLALDLGTTAFKAAAVDGDGRLLASPTVVRYALDYDAQGRVTRRPDAYVRDAFRALAGAARAARAAGLPVAAIGISSQAQTYVALDRDDRPLQDAVVWTDARADTEALALDAALGPVAERCGFLHLLPQQLLPKLVHLRRDSPAVHAAARRILLLNEFVVHHLTGQAVGDDTNQGMCGLFDVSTRNWWPEALASAGIRPEQLARIAPAATVGAPLKPDAAARLGIGSVPVFSCGNDQSCAAAGVGLDHPGDLLCNFGTAMVVTGRKAHWTPPTRGDQIAGIDPYTGDYFLLALENDCGNALDGVARLLYGRRGTPALLDAAARFDPAAAPVPQVSVRDGRIDIAGLSVGAPADALAYALVIHFADRFDALCQSVAGPDDRAACYHAAGGLSHSPAWLDMLARRRGRAFVTNPDPHPGLRGVARIVRDRGIKET